MIASHSIITTYHVTVGPQCPQWGGTGKAEIDAVGWEADGQHWSRKKAIAHIAEHRRQPI